MLWSKSRANGDIFKDIEKTALKYAVIGRETIEKWHILFSNGGHKFCFFLRKVSFSMKAQESSSLVLQKHSNLIKK